MTDSLNDVLAVLTGLVREREERARSEGYDRGVADERSRVMKVLGVQEHVAVVPLTEVPKLTFKKQEPADRWTSEDDALLEELWSTTDMTAEKVGERLGRTASAVYTRVKHREIVRKDPEAKPPLLDASKLPPLTEKQAKVFAGLSQATKRSSKGWAYPGLIKKLSGFQGVDDALRALEVKGYASRVGESRNYQWRVLAAGEPEVDEYGARGRPWSEEEFELLRALGQNEGDGYEAFGEANGRSEVAVIAQARMLRCFDDRLTSKRMSAQVAGLERIPIITGPAVYLDQEPVAVVAGPVIHISKEPCREAPPSPLVEEEEETGEEADIDDLAKTPREVLLAMRSLARSGKAATAEMIASLSEAHPDRIPGALTRLSELKLIAADGRVWRLTASGVMMADAVHAEEEV